MRLRVWCVLGALLAGCGEGPAAHYDDFLERTRRAADASADASADAAAPSSRYARLCGRWFLRSLLQGGIDLPLRIEFTPADGGECPTEGPATLRTRIWLERHTFDEPDILETTVEVDADGRFDIVADPLNLPKDILRGEVDVVARLVMHSRTLDADEWCGDAVGSVTVPITLDLAGSTFYARRDDDVTLAKDDLPFRCPDAPADAGVPDAGPVGGDGGPVDAALPPPPPDLSGVASEAHDLTGHWVLRARTPIGLPLELWLALTYAGGAEGASLDGALRLARNDPETPALVHFGTAVDADGRFAIWLPALELDTGTVVLEGDILLAGATLSGDAFCGGAAGEVRRPLKLDLAGTTFFAERWTPGTPVRADLPNACP